MKRDMIKTSNSTIGHIPGMYDMTILELQQLIEILHNGRDGEYDALDIAFRYGFALGARAERTGKYHLPV
ncbi:MAG: hypothetical protein Q4G00_13680 [Clostridia bacterium]|nr:hypothetical protein [Clostridia bacterium]